MWRYAALAALLLLAQPSLQQSDPIQDLCRRWLHQTCIVDSKLYIDGGLIDYGGSFNNDTVQSNTWLIYEDLSVFPPQTASGFPVQYDNLTKGPEVPSVSGGILWPDEVNRLFYLYGGEYYDSTPDSFDLWLFDTIYNTWNRTSTLDTQMPVLRAAHGAGTVVQENGWGYYYGGYLSNKSVPGWQGDSVMLSSLLKYDMVAKTWDNSTYDITPRAEGSLQYIPASDRGMLVYFGGVEQQSNGSVTLVPMDTIYLFDISAEKWYPQQAGGQIPPSRRGFCAGVTWAQDKSSYNIYLYGGFDENGDGFDDVYILSLPSFEWILWFPDKNTTSFPYGKGWSSCNVYSGTQMFIIGGHYSNTSYISCDVPSVGAQHGLSLGEQNALDVQWYQFLPNVTSYEVPANITATVGGGRTGGATLTTPAAGWSNPDLPVYFQHALTAETRTATRSIPATGSPTSTSSSSGGANVGAIAGGVVGGVVGLALIIGLVIWCLRSRRKKSKASQDQQYMPVEKDGVPINEAPTSPHSPVPRGKSGASYYSSHGSPPVGSPGWPAEVEGSLHSPAEVPGSPPSAGINSFSRDVHDSISELPTVRASRNYDTRAPSF